MINDPAVFQRVYETILSRETKLDGRYYVGIKTTGIYCRPSCRSRTPKPENVTIYGSIEAAQQAGYRACKRCRPDVPGANGPDAALAAQARELLRSRYAEPWTLPAIAGELRLSPFHLQRVFKRSTGTTPAKELLHIRMDRAKQLLAATDDPIANIASAVGIKGASHFSSLFQQTYGLTPHEYRLQHHIK
ncbi:bifunctional transcriptional activator/DNA repair enzyme AdaA [Paenibacillus koleovorans]|uniref:bifunctional transcriptional activator/DNA repair enzyme AdaA n=1 Tax=Paenibacillus koleovorans TaxID=121608 RepID=UPI001580227B|nr:Ada metal-binding domain-containing protein [Paenibacillus koleovorans]